MWQCGMTINCIEGGEKMKIKIINPNTTETMTKSIYESAVLYANSDTDIVAVSPKSGPESIENFHDEYAAIIGVMEEVHLGVKDRVDAFIIACYGDPGIYAAREISEVPVVGIAEASMKLATTVASKFSIIAVIPRTILMLEETVKKNGMVEQCASIRSTGLSVLDFEKDPKTGLERIKQESKNAILEDGAEAICLGCAGMTSFAKDLEDEFQVPVFDGVSSAVKLAEALVILNKKTSKVNYFKYPEKKNYKGYLKILQP